MTDLGEFVISVDLRRAPLSSGAFLQQVGAGRFDGGQFWRSVKYDTDRGEPPIEVIQASIAEPFEAAFVEHEPTSRTGLRHTDGVVSLPRAEGTPSSASGFFITIGDQPPLDAGSERIADREGFAAFGRVIDGMDLVREIHSRETSSGAPSGFLVGQMLKQPIRILRAAEQPEIADEQLATALKDMVFVRPNFPRGRRRASKVKEFESAEAVEDSCHLLVGRALLLRVQAIDPENLTTKEAQSARERLLQELISIVEGAERFDGAEKAQQGSRSL